MSCSRSPALSYATLLLLLLACESKAPEIYEIPDGYRGWVTIRFSRPSCEPLPKSGDTVVLKIAADGSLCTSSSLPEGMGHETYYYMTNAGRTLLRQSGDGDDSIIRHVVYHGHDGEGPDHEQDRDRMVFFVGSEPEYDASIARGSNPR